MFTAKPKVIRAYFQLERGRSPTFTLEVADTPELQAKGLMNRVQLPLHHGMLFAFKEPNRHGFWMKNTYIPLDIAWLDAQGYVQEVHQMQPGDEAMHRPMDLAKFAVEFRAGTLAAYGVRFNDRLTVLKS